MIKKNLILYYPSFERGGVEENLKNLINNFSNELNLHLISSLESSKSRKIFKKRCHIHNTKKISLLKFLPKRINLAISSMAILFKLIKKNKKKNLIIHSMQSNVAAIIICLILRVKIVIRNSEDPIYSTIYSENKVFSYLFFLSKIVFYNLCDGIITNSIGSGRSLKLFLLNKTKVQAIYNPYLRKKNNKKFKKERIIINIGRFRKQKNQLLLIRAFSKFNYKIKGYKLYLIGDGILKNRLIEEAEKLGIKEKVYFIGWVKNTSKYIKKAKLFVLPSLYEGLGNVLIDAINFNVPCISTNCKSGPNEILMNNKGGFIIRNKDETDLYKKMLYCIKNYDVSLKKNNYAKKYLSRFLTIKQVKKYEEYLMKFCNN